MLATPGPWLSDLRCFLFLKQLHWHSNSVAITSFLRCHMNLMFLISAAETVLREPIGHTSSGAFIKSLYIMLKMDYTRKMWTVVLLLRDDSVGHSSSSIVVTSLGNIFIYVAKDGLRLSNLSSWYASWRGDHKVFHNRCLRNHCCGIKWFSQMPLHSVLR